MEINGFFFIRHFRVCCPLLKRGDAIQVAFVRVRIYVSENVLASEIRNYDFNYDGRIIKLSLRCWVIYYVHGEKERTFLLSNYDAETCAKILLYL